MIEDMHLPDKIAGSETIALMLCTCWTSDQQDFN